MDKLKALKPEQKLLLSILSLGLVAGLYYYMVIMEMDNALSQAQKQVIQATKKKEDFKDFKGKIEVERLKEEYARVLRKIEKNKKILPEEERVPEFIHSLETDAEEAGVTIKSYKKLMKTSHDYYDSIPVQMNVLGTYMQLIRFMKLIAEPNKRLVNIENIHLTILKVKKKAEKAQQVISPFATGGSANQVLVETKFIANSFTYTGELASKKKGK
jgi:Tfp pilus assembly protein PilO